MSRRIGEIGNAYGDLQVKEDAGKYYWGIENWNGMDWEEIPRKLYRQLIIFQNSKEE